MLKNIENQVDSYIAEGVFFKGHLIIQGSLYVEGKFEGKIDLDEDLIIGERGKVRTNIFARRVVIEGILIGNIHAKEEVVLKNSAKVIGNIQTENLFMDKGVIVLGNVKITSDKYTLEQISNIVEDAFTSHPKVISNIQKIKDNN